MKPIPLFGPLQAAFARHEALDLPIAERQSAAVVGATEQANQRPRGRPTKENAPIGPVYSRPVGNIRTTFLLPPLPRSRGTVLGFCLDLSPPSEVVQGIVEEVAN
jgi:hypothetical protein